ncbi:MAG: hypothetical protein M5U08_13885 [Burkholderiales bacterium]|nr:hypothetical protein [Burkholderiales bacterium]
MSSAPRERAALAAAAARRPPCSTRVPALLAAIDRRARDGR